VELLPHIKSVNTFINHVENIQGRVLVHCIAGVSRSVSLIIMYMISNYKICLLTAYNHIKSLRGFIHPNDGFKAQLAKFEVAELGYSSIVTTKNAGREWDCYAINRYNIAVAQLSDD
jgi:atypical dual specificity phosphatase